MSNFSFQMFHSKLKLAISADSQSVLVIDKPQDLDDMSLLLFTKLAMEVPPLFLLFGCSSQSFESRPAVLRMRESAAIGVWTTCALQVSIK